MGSRARSWGMVVAGFVAGVAFVVACGSGKMRARIGQDGGVRDGGARDSGLFDSGLFDSGLFDSGGWLDSGIDAGRDASAQAVDCADWQLVITSPGNLALSGDADVAGGNVRSVPTGWFPVNYSSEYDRIMIRRCAP